MIRTIVVRTCDAPDCGTEDDVLTVRGNLGWAKDREIDLCAQHRALYNDCKELLFRHGRRMGPEPVRPAAPATAERGPTPEDIERVMANARRGRRALRFQCPDCPTQPVSPQGYAAHRRAKHGGGKGDPLPEPIAAA